MAYLDENNKPTKLAIEQEGWNEDMLAGRETEEHYQKRMEQWRKQFAIFSEWFDKRWGQGNLIRETELIFQRIFHFLEQESMLANLKRIEINSTM